MPIQRARLCLKARLNIVYYHLRKKLPHCFCKFEYSLHSRKAKLLDIYEYLNKRDLQEKKIRETHRGCCRRWVLLTSLLVAVG